jgi:hypothetical protein
VSALGSHGLEADRETNVDLSVADVVGDERDGHETGRAEAVHDLRRGRIGYAL